MKLTCMSCLHEFDGNISLDELGWHGVCPKCGASFPVDAPEFDVKAELKFRVTQEDIDDIMVSALEGGINYWCCEAEVVEEKRVADWGHEQIARGGVLILHDAESNDKWELTLEKFLAGVKMYVENGGAGCVCDDGIDPCEIDGCAADSIVQYALFGELVFG